MATGPNPTIGDAELLQHQAFVRRLARELIGNGPAADDLVQDAWVAALERPPRAAGALRSWFRVVIRNLVVREKRSDARRASREQAVARPVAITGPAEVAGRLALEQSLVRAVEELPEPYRAVVFLRYFEDLAPPAIAERLDVPLATVKTRLRRALASLRETLDRSGERKAWALALARTEPTASVALAPAGLWVAGAALVVLAAAWWLHASGGPRGNGPILADTVAATELVEAPELEEELAPPPETVSEESRTPPAELPDTTEHAVVPSPVTTFASSRAETETPLFLRGRVLFPDQSPASHACVAFSTLTTRTDARGSFELPIDPDALDEFHGARGPMTAVRPETALVAWLDGWVPAVKTDVGAQVLAGLSGEPLVLVLPGPALSIRGLVLDRFLLPAQGWRVSLVGGSPAFSGAYRPVSAEEFATGATSHFETDVDGRFEFRGLTPEKSYRVRAWNPTTLEQLESPWLAIGVVEGRPVTAGGVEVVLRAPDDGWRPLVEGIVTGLDGSPLAEVRCRLSMKEYEIEDTSWMTTGQEVHTDFAGRFAFVDVPPSAVFIRFHGHGSSASLDLEPAASGRDLVVTLVRAGAFRFDASSSSRTFSALRFLDESGERLRIEVDVPGGTRGERDLSISADGVAEGRVSEHARWLVLLRYEDEVERRPVLIRAGVTTELRP